MGTPSPSSAELAALTNPGEFLRSLLGSKLESFCDYGTKVAVNTTHAPLETFNLEIVDRVGGGEGEGEHVSRVIEVKNGDRLVTYIETTGYYESYNGTEWSDEFYTVYPRQVMVTQYHKERA